MFNMTMNNSNTTKHFNTKTMFKTFKHNQRVES